MKFFDAHNHLHDARLASVAEEFLASGAVAGMVVNGTSEEDWAAVTGVAAGRPGVQPSYGVHPWRVDGLSGEWRERLTALWDGGGVVGEIGLDRWKTTDNFERRREVFRWQWAEAARRDLPTTVHCLRAWGALEEIVRRGGGPRFLLHAYGGPAEMVPGFAARGAYFSFSGAFLAEAAERKREAFRVIPLARLLVETDAPDMLLPPGLDRHPINDPAGGRVNHPANLMAAYEGLAGLRGMPLEELAGIVSENYARLFGG